MILRTSLVNVLVKSGRIATVWQEDQIEDWSRLEDGNAAVYKATRLFDSNGKGIDEAPDGSGDEPTNKLTIKQIVNDEKKIMKPEFTGTDLDLIRSLKYDPLLEPSYEYLRGCLFWEDERPEGLTSDADDLIGSLIFARSLLQRGLTLEDHPVDPEYCKNLWAMAQQQISEWPGFKRLSLNDKDRRYLENEINKASAHEC
ncbi:hypothetical protein BH11CYA1_BH11CYA1_41090 [soil metagenome]